MKFGIKSFSLSVLVFALIVVTVWIGYVGFIGGPARAYEREDRLYVETMMEAKGYTQGRLINRFAFDEVYYIAEVSKDDVTTIVWFNKDLKKFGEHDVISKEPIAELAKNFGIKENQVSLGVYQERLVYVLKNRKFEKFIDVETLELVYDRG